MSFLSITAALVAAGLTVPTLIALYFLKLKRKKLDISSTLLWEKAIKDMQVNSPFQKLKKSLLLLLQLLLLAALLLAFARPTRTGLATAAGERTVIVIDHSASMNATEGGQTRLNRAKDEARALIDQIVQGGGSDSSRGAGAMIVTFAARARVLQPFTSDPALLRRAIDSVKPTDQSSRLSEALSLVQPFVSQDRAASAGNADAPGVSLIILSDGRLTEDGPQLVRGANSRFVRIGGPTAPGNLAFVAMNARRDFEDQDRVEIFARLTNFGSTPIDTNVTLRLNGKIQKVTRVKLGANESTPVQFEMRLSGAASIELFHDHNDALPADDRAGVGIAPPKDAHVLVVTRGNTFLERVIASVGARRVLSLTPDDYEDLDPSTLRRDRTSGGGGFDLIVYDGYSPEQTPPTNAIYFGAAPPIDGLRLVPWQEEDGRPRGQVALDWRRDHPLLRYVALDDLVMDRPARLVVPVTARVLMTGQAGPLMAILEQPQGRHVVAGFGLLRSVWPIQVSFAVFMTNALETLGSSTGGLETIQYRSGQVATVPTIGDMSEIRYTGPNELEATFEDGRAILPAFERAGVYVAANSDIEPPWNRLMVNLLDVNESDLKPADSLKIGSTAETAEATPPAIVRREVWRYFAWAALGLLMLEWLVFTRRMHL